MSLPCRCTKCGARKSIRACRIKELKKISEWHPKCQKCGNKKWRIDKWRIKNELGINPSCDCGAYHFRHRKGGGYCYYHPDAEMRDIERRA